MEIIDYPRIKQLHKRIEFCRLMTQRLGEARCMVLEGESGAGKTTLVRDYIATANRTETPYGSKIPYLYVQTPSPITVKGMASAILRHLGDPRCQTGSQWAMDARIRHFIKQCEVLLVIFDDFHHLIDPNSKRVFEEVSDWLKVLVKDTKIPYVVIGIENTVGQILDTNDELRRLFIARETLQAFRYGAKESKATNKEFGLFIKRALNIVGMEFSDELKPADLLYRIHYLTDGVVAHVMNLLHMAAMLSAAMGNDAITLHALSTAFRDGFAANMPHKEDPFANSALPTVTNEPEVTTVPSGRQPSVREVLTAS